MDPDKQTLEAMIKALQDRQDAERAAREEDACRRDAQLDGLTASLNNLIDREVHVTPTASGQW